MKPHTTYIKNGDLGEQIFVGVPGNFIWIFAWSSEPDCKKQSYDTAPISVCPWSLSHFDCFLFEPRSENDPFKFCVPPKSRKRFDHFAGFFRLHSKRSYHVSYLSLLWSFSCASKAWRPQIIKASIFLACLSSTFWKNNHQVQKILGSFGNKKFEDLFDAWSSGHRIINLGMNSENIRLNSRACWVLRKRFSKWGSG